MLPDDSNLGVSRKKMRRLLVTMKEVKTSGFQMRYYPAIDAALKHQLIVLIEGYNGPNYAITDLGQAWLDNDFLLRRQAKEEEERAREYQRLHSIMGILDLCDDTPTPRERQRANLWPAA